MVEKVDFDYCNHSVINCSELQEGSSSNLTELGWKKFEEEKYCLLAKLREECLIEDESAHR